MLILSPNPFLAPGTFPLMNVLYGTRALFSVTFVTFERISGFLVYAGGHRPVKAPLVHICTVWSKVGMAALAVRSPYRPRIDLTAMKKD
jgi:hypothetical protein